jgi:hypothetical protein
MNTARQKNNQYGVSLLEVVIATAVISIAFLGFIGAYSSISKSMSVNRARSLAYSLLQEKIEKIKSMDYYRVVPTSQLGFDNDFSPAIVYDTRHFLPETIPSGGIIFKRYTYIQNVQEVDGDITGVSPNTDPGMKEISVTVTWTGLGGKKNKAELKNIISNPNTITTNSMFTGKVKDASTVFPIPGAMVTVSENSSWQDRTDGNGDYTVRAMMGTYYLTAIADGYFPSTIMKSISPNQTITVDFSLTKKQFGCIKSSAWLNDHPVISQVVANTVSPSGNEQEYVELYNPTTYYFKMSNGMSSPVVNLFYQDYDDMLSTQFTLNYAVSDSSIPPQSYYLIANTDTVDAGGQIRNADAYYTPGMMSSDTIRSYDAASVFIQWASNSKNIDLVGWNRTGKGQAAQFFEGTAIIQNVGFSPEEQYVRRTSTANVLEAGYANVYDSHNNEIDFFDQAISVPPRNSTDSETLTSGTPAYGATISCNDGLSSVTTAYYMNYPGSSNSFAPYAEYFITRVATGTWNVVVASAVTASDCYYIDISSAVVLANTTTFIPNDITAPTWPCNGEFRTILFNETTDGFISGKITDVLGKAIDPMKISAGGTDYPVSSEGSYFIQLATGSHDVTANPNNYNADYVYQSREVVINKGQITSAVNFLLPQGGIIYGGVTVDGISPLPAVVVTAKDFNGIVSAQEISDSSGQFSLRNLSTGTYTVEPILGSKETAAPENYTQFIDIGDEVYIGSFTVTGTLGIITGSVTDSGIPIKTGVLIVATTVPLTSTPPALSTATLTVNALYSTSSLEDGSYSVEVRGSTVCLYNVYGWYPRLNGGTISFSRQSQASVSAQSGHITSGVNLSW